MNLRLTTILAAIAVAVSVSTTDAAPRVDPALHRTLRKQGAANVIVELQESTQEALESLEEVEFASRGAKIASVVESLQAHTSASQQSLEQLLMQESSTHSGYQKFWITNKVFIKDASVELIEKLGELSNVKAVREEKVIMMEEPVVEEEFVDMQVIGHEWGVKRVQAPEVWQDGTFGQNVVVAAIDTGALGTHEALKNNFRGEFGWFDPESKKAEPYDFHGHGTHVVGTIAGGKGVGVAPGAKWMACKGCRTSGCPESDLTACAEFVTCPHDTNGENKDCSKAPHIVSNSWGGGNGDPFYADQVAAWHKAGIIPVFANGNAGPSCSTANSPGDYPNVIGVGATDVRDALARFSSKGPSVTGLLKPDISAPGVRIRSSWKDNDQSYRAISGTSMACPHVSGAIALLLSVEPQLKYDDVLKRLRDTADQTGLVSSGMTCGNTTDADWPNNQFGHGVLNVLSAYQGERPSPTPTPTPSPSPSPTTPAPTTPAPTTPAPTTSAPTPTPAPTPKPHKFCNTFKTRLSCNLWFWCKWDNAESRCNGRFH